MREGRGGFGGVVKQEGLGPWGDRRRIWGRGMGKNLGTWQREREGLGAREERSEQPSPAQHPHPSSPPLSPQAALKAARPHAPHFAFLLWSDAFAAARTLQVMVTATAVKLLVRILHAQGILSTHVLVPNEG